MLYVALSQWGWYVEGHPPSPGVSSKLFEILDFRLEGEKLLLVLRKEVGVEVTIVTPVARVFLEGRFGQSPHAEPRRFTIACPKDPEVEWKIRQGIFDGHWREISPRAVGLIFVRDEHAPPGWPMEARPPYGFKEHIKRLGSGENLLRTERIAQPRALQVGDVLATGDWVLSLPRLGFNSSVLIHLSGGLHGHWIKVAPRLPIALLSSGDKPPPELWNLK